MNTMALVIEYSVVLDHKTILRNRLEQCGVSESVAFLWQREFGGKIPWPRSYNSYHYTTFSFFLE